MLIVIVIQEATGGHRKPQEATGDHRRPQEATGGHIGYGVFSANVFIFVQCPMWMMW
jgi:hypothetical protein